MESLYDLQKLNSAVVSRGWSIVTERESSPPYAYTVGLFENFLHPEILIFGTEMDHLCWLLNQFSEAIKIGATFQDEFENSIHVIDDFFFFRTIRKQNYLKYLGVATSHYYGNNFPALQCNWRDEHGRFPWHVESTDDSRRAQPALYDPAGWLFHNGRNRIVVASRQVLEAGWPCVRVTHHENSRHVFNLIWEFSCGTARLSADWKLTTLENMVDVDCTLEDLADLQPGYRACRDEIGGAWKRTRVRRR
jgi:hypothetical protein